MIFKRGRKTIRSKKYAESDTISGMKQTEEDAERMREAFRQAMDETGLKLETWCKLAGIAGNGPRTFLKGKTSGLHTSTVLALARAIRWPASRLMAQSAMTLPIIGNMLTGGEILIADIAMQAELGEIDAPPGADLLTRAISVNGRDNFPEFDDGDVILYREDWQPAESMVGKRSVIQLADGRLLVGRVLNGHAPGRHMVQRINSPPILDADIKGVTPIRWVIPAV